MGAAVGAMVTLAEEQRQRTRDRILRAARTVMAERGLATRIEDVAAVAGVGRRTVFRHFESRDALLASALHESMRSYGEHIPAYTDGADLGGWLQEALEAIHRMNARHGRIYWELAFADDLDGPLAEVAAARRRGRQRLVRNFTRTVWRAAGGRGRAPSWLADVVAVQLSAFATQALVGDFGRSPEEAGRAGARAILASVVAAAGEQPLRAMPTRGGQDG